jgi:hypothetical protein
MIWNAAIMIGGMMLIAGMLGNYIEQNNAGSREARAVRAFFKAYADDTQVSYTRPKDDGSTDWVIDVRSISNRNKPYTAVPTELLLKLSDETGVTTPWPDIIVEAVKEPTP